MENGHRQECPRPAAHEKVVQLEVIAFEENDWNDEYLEESRAKASYR
jgi:hypothetical protein